MGGTDLFDMSSFYRIDHKSKIFYRRIFFWVLGSSLVNAWLHYRRHYIYFQYDPKEELNLLKFLTDVNNSLCEGKYARQEIQAPLRGRPVVKQEPIEQEESSDEEPAPPRKRNCVIVPDAIRYDHTDHFPDMVEKAARRRCRVCSSHSQVICIKC